METYPLPTTFGTDSMEITFTERNHAHACYQRAGIQVINRVEYRGNVHLFLWSDGRYRVGRETDTPYERHQQLFLNRAHWTNYSQSHASESARARFATEVENAVNKFVLDNPSVPQDAERQHLQNELEKAEHAYRAAVDAADEAMKARNLAQVAVDNFRGAK